MKTKKLSDFYLIKDVGVYRVLIDIGTYEELDAKLDEIDLRGGDSKLFTLTTFLNPLVMDSYAQLVRATTWGAE